MQATITKTQNAPLVGQYTRTPIDDAKTTADFLLIDVSCAQKVIDWKDGRREWVTSRQLKQLQAKHTWATNF